MTRRKSLCSVSMVAMMTLGLCGTAQADTTGIASAAYVDAKIAQAISQNVAAQIGTMANLDTEHKETLVGAINETYAKASAVPEFVADGEGNVVTAIEQGKYMLSNVKIPVGGPDETTYAQIWVE